MKTPDNQKLYRFLEPLKLYSHFALGRLATKDGSGLPFFTWPNGKPCSIANIYMLSLRDRPGRSGARGLSRRGSGGGTIGEYASKISPFIRFVYRLELDFIEINDSIFTQFIKEMRQERSLTSPNALARTETSLLSIGRVCIDFLQFVGRMHGEPEFVSEKGTIRVELKEFVIIGRNGRPIKRPFLHHHSLPLTGSRTHTRDPIIEDDIKKLRAAVNSIDSSRNIQIRRNLMLSLYENTGARRGEIGDLRVSDIKNALKMKRPMLRMITLKQGAEHERMIPIARSVLSEANKYIRIARTKSMRKYKEKDHDYLFVQDLTGKPLHAETFNKEIMTLRLHAGIDQQVCGHMFRHAFITNLFVLLIKRHRFKNQDDFRNAFLHTAHFMTDVMMWTGHKSASSVERYIHLAFARLDGYEETASAVHLIRVNRIYDRAEEELVGELENGLSPAEYAMKLRELKRQRMEDLQSEEKPGSETLKIIQATYLDHHGQS